MIQSLHKGQDSLLKKIGRTKELEEGTSRILQPEAPALLSWKRMSKDPNGRSYVASVWLVSRKDRSWNREEVF